jgi:ATP-dependent DNA ligase
MGDNDGAARLPLRVGVRAEAVSDSILWRNARAIPRSADLLGLDLAPSGRIVGVPMPFQPMLAPSSAPRRLTGRWVLEPKFDGWRVIVAVDGDVRVWTRRGHDLTERLPELAALADAIDAPAVLDGELVAGQGRASDFYGVLPRVAARNRRLPLTFVAFDVLAYDVPVIDQPYARRRALLDGLALNGPAWCTTPSCTAALSTCWPRAASTTSRA